MTAEFILNGQYIHIHLEMPYNHFHASFTSPSFLIVDFKTLRRDTSTSTQPCSQKAPS